MYRSTLPARRAAAVLAALLVVLPTAFASAQDHPARSGSQARVLAPQPAPRVAQTTSDACQAPTDGLSVLSFDPQAPAAVYGLDYATPRDSGFVFGTNHYLDRAKGTFFSLPPGTPQATLQHVDVWFGYKYTALWTEQYDLSYTLQVYDGSPETGPVGDPLTEQRHVLIDVKADADFSTPAEPTRHTLVEPVTVGPTFFVSVDFGDYGADGAGRLGMISSERLERRVAEVWERQESGVWANVSDAWFGQGGLPGDRGWQLWMEAGLSAEGAYVGTPCAWGLPLRAEGLEEYDRFGTSVAATADAVVVGSTGTRLAGASDTEVGYLRFFARHDGQWRQQARLAPADQIYGEGVGSAVALDGGYAAAGAPRKGLRSAVDEAGAVYVFARSGTAWTQQTRLAAGDARDEDHFGTSVALSGDLLVAGAPDKDVGTAPNAGGAYVFTRTGAGWTEQARLTPPDLPADAAFGRAVAVSSDYILVGAPYRNEGAVSAAGAAYLFARSGPGWSLVARLTAGDATAFAGFGSAVALGPGVAVVGAPGANAVYVFAPSGGTWTQVQRLTASDADTRWGLDDFGESVALDGKRLVVGAPGARLAYVFTFDGTAWKETDKLTAEVETQALGRSVALAGNAVFVADPEFAPSIWEPLTGAVFEYALPTSPVATEGELPPATFALDPPFPNPFRSETRFTLRAGHTERVAVEVYDLTGRRVAQLYQGTVAAGTTHAFTLDGASLPSGVYVIRVAGERSAASHRAVLVR